jgi:hypothetical protein
MVGKRGSETLRENIIFLILNLLFLSVMFLFLYLRTGDAVPLEEKYAKQIALLIDSAEPGMIISLDMEDALNIAKRKGLSTGEVVSGEDKDVEGEIAEVGNEIVMINENIVTVRLRQRGNYSYSFFNDVKVNEPYFNENKLVLYIEEKTE